MLILGIDPGTATTGYGLLKTHAKRFEVLEFGLIETEKNSNPGKRLVSIQDEMFALLRRFSPDVVAIERLFFAANAKTAMAVGEAKGVTILAAARHNIEVVEYAPGTIKKVVAGGGKADKKRGDINSV